MKKTWASIFLPLKFFIAGSVLVIVFVLGFFWPLLFVVAKFGLILFAFLTLLDLSVLFKLKNGVIAKRELPDRFSNGDQNPVSIKLKSNYPLTVDVAVIDELPVQFQIRDFKLHTRLKKNQATSLTYSLRPVKRGEYQFGSLNIFVRSPLGLIEKRFRTETGQNVSVYPSFHQLKNVELMSFARMQNLLGLKTIRKVGNNREFEQVKDYIEGDDTRSINWKATAKKSRLMVNRYRDEREQHVYCIIDMGRSMKMPFNEMSLLDYAINSSLAVSKVVLKNYDKIGLITYSNKVHTVIQSDNSNKQMRLLMDGLYKQKTDFKESSLEVLYPFIRQRITQRSLMILFTNFESIYSIQRQMAVVKKLAQNHLVLLVAFENVEMRDIIKKETKGIESVYLKTIAQKFIYEKRIFMSELNQGGVLSLLTAPDQLSVNTINKYLEVKARGLL